MICSDSQAIWRFSAFRDRWTGHLCLVRLVLGLTLFSIPASLPAQDGDFGWVPQSVQPINFRENGQFDLAVAYAFTDSVAILGTDPSGKTFPLFVDEVGMYPGIMNDLPRQILVRDFTQDGIDDLLVLSSGNPNMMTRSSIQILRGLPHGDFVTMPAQMAEVPAGELRFPTCVAAEDLNADGLLDLVVGNTNRNSLTIFHGVGLGQFEFATERILPGPTGVTAVALVDLNADRRPDLVLATHQSVLVGLATNHGGFPTLWEVSSQFNGALLSLAVGDLDQSGRLDLVVTNDSGSVVILHDLDAVSQTVARRQDIDLPVGSFLSDVALVDWTRDGRTEVAVVDKHSNQVVILFPNSNVAPLPIPVPSQAPRRMAVVDLNGDGSPDIVTVNEGDREVFENPDLAKLINPHASATTADLHVEGRILLAPLFPGSPRFIGATSSGLLGLNWVYDRASRELAGFTSEGQRAETLRVAAPNPMLQPVGDPAGLAFESAGGGRIFLLDEASGQIRQYLLVGDQLQPLSPPATEPTRPGLRGLAFHSATKQLWTMDTAQRRLMVLDLSGTVVGQFDLEFPADLIALDPASERIYLSRRGTVRVAEFQAIGTALVPTGVQFHLPQIGVPLQTDTIAGLGWNAERAELIVITNNRAMATLKAPFPPGPTAVLQADWAPLSRGGQVEALAYDQQRAEVLILDLDGLPAVIATGLDGGLRRVVELSPWHEQPAPGNQPPFTPATLAWDAARDEILVGDRWTTRFAVYSPEGQFLEMLQWPNPSSALPVSWPPFTGLAIDEEGVFRLRSQSGVLTARRDGTALQFVNLTAQDAGDLAAEGVSLFGLAPREKRLDEVSGHLLGSGTIYLNHLNDPAETLAGLATAQEANLFLVGAPAKREVILLRRLSTADTGPAWTLYE